MKRSTGRRAASAAAPPPPAAPSGKAPAATVEAACPAARTAAAADKAAHDPSSMELCECCGKAVVEGQWTVQVRDSLQRCHYDCWQDPLSKAMAFTERAYVIATLPACDVLAMGRNLKDLRRELRDACQECDKFRSETRALKQDLTTAHDDTAESWLGRAKEIQGLCGQRDEARAAAEKQREENMKLRQEVASATEELARERLVAHSASAALDRTRDQRDAARVSSNAFLLELEALRVEHDELVAHDYKARLELLQERLDLEVQKGLRLLGEDIGDYSEEELVALRGQLETAQDRVAKMLQIHAAEGSVTKKFPHYQCPISLSLMRDPVVTVDGQSYERTNIEQWFQTCRDAKEPVTSPLRAPLASDALVPNHSLRRAIDEALEHELVLFEVAVQLKLDASRAGGAAKRPRADK